MGLDRVFSTPTIEVDQDKYDELIKIKTLYEEKKKENSRENETMDFGQAIRLLKDGKKVARQGWNGKKQYIELATNISFKTAKSKIINAEHDAIGNKAIAFVGTSGVQLGWLASQADMLAEDWIIKE